MKYIQLSDNQLGFINYADVDDLMNKRDSFVREMKLFHEEALTDYPPDFGIRMHLDSLIDQLEELPGYKEDKGLQQLTRIYITILRRVAIKFDDGLVKKSLCHNNLFFNNIYHDTYGKVAMSNISNLGMNDCAWDYAAILARSSDCHNYVGILNANRLSYEVTNKYRDKTFPIRLIMCMALIDFMDILKFAINKEKKGIGSYGELFGSDAHTEELVTERLLSFVTQSYTTIDYFSYIFNDKN